MDFDIVPLPGYPDDYALLLASLQDSTSEWRGELGEPDVETIVWQPFSNGYSIGSLLLHIGQAEVFWFEQFGPGLEPNPEIEAQLMCELTDVDNCQWPTPPREPLAYYYNILDRIRARSLEHAKSFPRGETAKAHHGGSKTYRWMISHVVQHDSYHGGQAVLLHEMHKRYAEGE